MKIVLVEPGKEAREAEITGSLREMQKLVGGLIQTMYLWEDPVALVCNDEGKILGMPLNRVLEDYDVIAGPFFICGIEGDHFCSLTEEQAKTYLEKFRQPELIYRNPVGIPSSTVPNRIMRRCKSGWRKNGTLPDPKKKIQNDKGGPA